jgi:predicted DNA-binding protein
MKEKNLKEYGNVRLSKELKAKIKKLALQKGKSMSAVIRKAIKETFYKEDDFLTKLKDEILDGFSESLLLRLLFVSDITSVSLSIHISEALRDYLAQYFEFPEVDDFGDGFGDLTDDKVQKFIIDEKIKIKYQEKEIQNVDDWLPEGKL